MAALDAVCTKNTDAKRTKQQLHRKHQRRPSDNSEQTNNSNTINNSSTNATTDSSILNLIPETEDEPSAVDESSQAASTSSTGAAASSATASSTGASTSGADGSTCLPEDGRTEGVLSPSVKRPVLNVSEITLLKYLRIQN